MALGADLAPLSSAGAKLLPRPMRSLKALSLEDACDAIGVVVSRARSPVLERGRWPLPSHEAGTERPPSRARP
jgi:hypothetical protein